MITIVTGNAGKAKEIASFFEGISKVNHIALELIEPQASNLEEIARYKVKQAYEILNQPVIVDDTGLFIKSLNGFPGVYAAFVQGSIGNDGILKLMKNITDRSAYFETVIAYADDAGIRTFNGRVDGIISESPSGSEGFGYDPIFTVNGKKLAEMSVEEKNKLSHRARALMAFRDWFTNRT